MKVINCKEGHALVKLTGKDDEELVKNAREHLTKLHPQLGNMSREQILAMATNE